jgi:iron complex outermembrane receptor protein
MTKPLSAAIALALATSLLSAHAFAQDATSGEQDGSEEEATRLDTVIVTGTRAPKSVDKIPGAVTLVSKEEVKHTLAVTEDATAVLARTVPGYAGIFSNTKTHEDFSMGIFIQM